MNDKKTIELGTVFYIDSNDTIHYVINQFIFYKNDTLVTACEKFQVDPKKAIYGNLAIKGKYVNCRDCLKYKMELDWE